MKDYNKNKESILGCKQYKWLGNVAKSSSK